MSLYAVKIGNWIEIREGKSPPKRVRQVITIKPRKKRVYDYDADTYKYKTIKTVERFVWKGGSCKGLILSRNFTVITKLMVYNDRALLVPPDKQEAVLNEIL